MPTLHRLFVCLKVLAGSTLLGAAASAEDLAAQDSAWSIDWGAELRERFESSSNPVFGLSSPAQNDYLLTRAIANVTVQRDRFRTLVELVSGTASSWSGTPPPTQDDPLDVLQALAEASWPLAGGQLGVRAGRQVMSFGSSRLVSVREGPNVRRAFDGLDVSWVQGERTRIDAFAVRPVFAQDGTFDDRSSREQRFWGIYASGTAAGQGMDAYYLGLHRDGAEFTQGQDRETRHTVGVRVFGERERADWNLEAAWQWGSFGSADITAWTASADVGVRFPQMRFAPRLGLKADIISGDHDLKDGTLGTFNPLFPKLPYFSEANLATPANLFDLQPSLTLHFTDRASFQLSWDVLWKYAKADAFYAPPLTPVEGTSMSAARDIGWQLSALMEWSVTEHVAFTTTYVTFEPRSVIEKAGGRDGNFFAAWVELSF